MKSVYSICILFGLIFISFGVTFAYSSPGGVLRVETPENTTNVNDPGITIIEVLSTDVETKIENNSTNSEVSVEVVVPPETGTGEVDVSVKVDSADGTAVESVILQNNETDLEFIRERAVDTTDKGHKGEIDILSIPAVAPTKGGVEYQWKIEAGEKVIPEGEDDESDEGNGVEEVHMNKGDLIERISVTSEGGLRAGFVKIEGIEGDVTGDSESKKPKEIVVVGSKVRTGSVPRVVLPPNDPKAYSADSFFDIFIDIEDEDLGLYAVGLAQKDEGIEEVIVTDEEVILKYKTEIRILGIIPVPTTQRATVTFGDGLRGSISRVKVQMPWWNIFGRKTVRSQDLKIALEDELAALEIREADEKETSTESLSFNFNTLQARTLQTVSNIMKAKHDAAMNSIRNLK